MLLAPDVHLDSAQRTALGQKLRSFTDQLKQDRLGQPADLKFLRHIHRQVFKSFLKKYAPHSSLGELLTTQRYNCLSGSLLLAIVLRETGFVVNVHETTIHAYLTVALANDTEALIETTDPVNGLLLSPALIAQRKRRYVQEDLAARKQAHSSFVQENNTVQTVNYCQIAGLLFYNEAVERYNRQEYEQTVVCLQSAMAYYEAERNIWAMLKATGQLLKSHELAEGKRQSLTQLHQQYQTWFQKISSKMEGE